MKTAERKTRSELARKERNRRRRVREYLDTMPIAPPTRYVRRLRQRPPEWHGIEVRTRENRKVRRRYGLSLPSGVMPAVKEQRLRGARRRARAHRRRMEAR